jgi:hypothetical protein
VICMAPRVLRDWASSAPSGMGARLLNFTVGRMSESTLLETLRGLELETHQSHVRADPVRLGRFLHPDFFEIGRSGNTYSRDEILTEFAGRPPAYRIWSGDFHIESLTERFALLTYLSAHIRANGSLERHTARASLWQLTDLGWQIRFHQGTPIPEFQKHAV